MPKPEAGESMEKFMKRFMGAKRDKKWKPKQREAIAYSEYDEHKRDKRK